MAALTSVEFKEFLFNNRDTLSAACGSLASTVSGFPLDSVKSRLQVKRFVY